MKIHNLAIFRFLKEKRSLITSHPKRITAIRRDAKLFMNTLRLLPFAEETAGKQLVPKLIPYAVWYGSIRLTIHLQIIRLKIVIILVLTLLLVELGILVGLKHLPWIDNILVAGSIFLAVVIFLFSDREKYRYLEVGAILGSVVFIVISYIVHSGIKSQNFFVAHIRAWSIGALLYTITIIGILLWVGAEDVIFTIDDKNRRRRHANKLIVAELVFFLHTLKRCHLHPSIYTREWLMQRLEEIAVTFEVLPERTLSSDLATEKWFRNITSEIAANVRSLKQDVLLFSCDGRLRLQKEGNSMLAATILGQWEKFARKEVSHVSRRERWAAIFIKVIKGAIAVLLPFAAVLAPRALHVPLDSAIEKAIISFGVMFSLASLIGSIDPSASSRIGGLKDWMPGVKADRKERD